MKYIENNTTNPFFNLALEEYLLKNKTDDFLILWRNDKTVVVGKHQNLHSEIVQPFAVEKNMTIARRLSGGGTVYHDLGNLNFTYIQKGEQGKLVDFKKYITPIVDCLVAIGAPAQMNSRSDILVNGLKVSGNAEHVFKDKVIHHGTLLFDSVLSDLNGVVRNDQSAFQTRAVSSVRSPVANISTALDKPISIQQFQKQLANYLQKALSLVRYELSPHDKQAVAQLATEKYATWDWVFGYSPKFTLNKTFELNNETIAVTVDVKKGYIENFVLLRNHKVDNESTKLLQGKPFDIIALEPLHVVENWPVFLNKLFC